MSIYAGGIPEHGFKTNLSTDMEGENLSQPQPGPSEIGFNKVGLGSTQSGGGTGQDVNPPAPGEIQIATRKTIENNS